MNKIEMPYEIDKDGMVGGVHYHDGQILAFSFSENICYIQLRHLGGSTVELQLTELHKWGIDFWDWAIIDTIYIWKIKTLVPELKIWNNLYRELNKPDDVKKVAAAVIKKFPESFLIHIDCSYGGNMAAVCNHITFYEALESKGAE
ncbi:MAG: hypothetical protein EA357_11845 [Micavibrio sp.]|nr:MAG: hypothetical protein EA357_11845 [Micavibrio sp.]